MHLEDVIPAAVSFVPRRDVVRHGLIWAAAGTTAATVNVALAAPAPPRAEVAYDVATLGETFRIVWRAGAPASGDLRGSWFSTQGAVYPAGTITGPDFDPAGHAAERIGTWFCRGWFLIRATWPEPPLTDILGSGDPGGPGCYVGTSGAVHQRRLGANATVLAGSAAPAPNFRLDFRRL